MRDWTHWLTQDLAAITAFVMITFGLDPLAVGTTMSHMKSEGPMGRHCMVPRTATKRNLPYSHSMETDSFSHLVNVW